MSQIRALVGPLLFGVALWCAAGSITIADAAAPAVRLAVPAPWWVCAIAVVAALAVPVFRRHPWAAAPSVLAIVPWLPLPVPDIALIWTGPLAWLPPGCAAAVAVVPAVRAGVGRLVRLPPARAAVVAGTLSLFLGVLTAWSVAPRLPGGDEPHYLVITQSLLLDGDLRIENNHVNRDYASYFGGELAPDVIRRGRNGEVYSIHAPGVSVLAAPAFAAWGYRGAQATILLLAALTGALLWRLAWLAGGDAGAAWFAWLAVAGSATFLLQSAMVFPDGPGALAVALGCWLLLRLRHGQPTAGPAGLVGTSVALAALPWLHTRFVVLAAGFGLAVAIALLQDRQRPVPARVRRLFTFAAVPVVSAIAWFGFFYVLYGTPDPTAPYGDHPETSLTFVPGGLAGLLFDQQFGLLAVTPVLVAVAAGLWVGRDRRTWPPVLVGAAYLAVSATYWMWWAGRPATPARFATAALPVLVLPLSLAWLRASAAARVVWSAVIGWSVTLSLLLIAVGRGALAWNDRDANAGLLEWLGPLVDLPRGAPSFFWRLDPAQLSTEWPFAVHAAVWIAIPILGGLALVALAGRPGWSVARVRLATAWWLPISLAISTQVGWWLTGARSIDPARSQTAVLAAAAPAGGEVLAIGRLWLARSRQVEGLMRLRPEQPGRLAGPAAPAVFTSIPPGRYEVVIALPGPVRTASGTIVVRLGRDTTPLAILGAVSEPEQRVPIDLAAGARTLLVETTPALRRAGAEVSLVPRSLYARRAGAGAVALARLGSVQVFFEDDGVFAEPEGFWVRGGRGATFTVALAEGRTAVDIEVRNGGSENRIEVTIGDQQSLFDLGPFETRSLPVSADADGHLRVRVSSSSGFRPSDTGAGEDTRYLGVWVMLR